MHIVHSHTYENTPEALTVSKTYKGLVSCQVHLKHYKLACLYTTYRHAILRRCSLTGSRVKKLLLKCCNLLTKLVVTSEMNRIALGTQLSHHSPVIIILPARDFPKGTHVFLLHITHIIFEICFLGP